MTYNDSTDTLTVVNIVESSALKYKKDIIAISESLNNVRQLQGVYYTRIEDESKHIGFIADDVYKVYPELVEVKDGEVESLRYQRITAVLVEAVKELSDKVDTQEEIIKGLIERIIKLENK
jgi:hypothetical protein